MVKETGSSDRTSRFTVEEWSGAVGVARFRRSFDGTGCWGSVGCRCVARREDGGCRAKAYDARAGRGPCGNGNGCWPRGFRSGKRSWRELGKHERVAALSLETSEEVRERWKRSAEPDGSRQHHRSDPTSVGCIRVSLEGAQGREPDYCEIWEPVNAEVLLNTVARPAECEIRKRPAIQRWTVGPLSFVKDVMGGIQVTESGNGWEATKS